MKRGILDTLRRGLDNALANWGLVLVRLVTLLLMAAMTVGAVLAMVVPVLVSIGIKIADFASPENVEGALFTLLERWSLLVFIFLGLSLLVILLVAMQAVAVAGCARVQVDAERMAGPAVDGPRSRYHVFSMARWWEGAKDGWWTVFWIYNFAWGVAGLILLIPLLPTLVLTLLLRDNAPLSIGIGCLGLLVSLMLGIVVGVVTGIWTNRAVADWALTRTGASSALSSAWAAIKADFGRHLVIAIAMFVIAIAGSSFFASFSYFAAFGEMLHETAVVNFFTIPLRLLVTLANWAFSSFVASWILGAYAALAVEGRR
ncbi:MAG TPA: hypothetical protein VF266_22550 [Thermoanaerobaculia bacterium]